SRPSSVTSIGYDDSRARHVTRTDLPKSSFAPRHWTKGGKLSYLSGLRSMTSVDSNEPIDTAQARPSLPPRPSLPATHQRRVQPRHVAAERPSQDPPVDDKTKAPYLLRALRFAVQHGATDLHFHCGLPLIARAGGRLMPFQGHKPLNRVAAE